MVGALILAEDSGFFRNELSWDGIIGIIAITLPIVGGLIFWRLHSWRQHHPLRVVFVLDRYDDQASEIRDSNRYAPFWQTWTGTEKHALLKICPRVETTFRNIRFRLVERKWFPRYKPWRWVPADRKVIQLVDMIDMRYAKASAPMHYYECDIEPPEGSFLGHYFNDHDHAKGVTVPAGTGLWIGIIVEAWAPWRGRLEIDTVVAGQRIFERKRFHVDGNAPADKALYHLGLNTNRGMGRQFLPEESKPSSQSSPDKASSEPKPTS